MFVRHLLLLLLFACTAGAACANTPSPHDAVRIGVLAYLGGDAGDHSWAPVAARLKAALPGREIVLFPLDHQGLHDAAAKGEIDFVITNPGHYVELEAELGISRILTYDPGPAVDAAHAIGSAVIVRKDRTDLRTLADLPGTRLAVVSRNVFGGFQLVWRELRERGLADSEDFADLQEVGFPMQQIFHDVAIGRADAGIVRACLLEHLSEWQDTLRVLDPRPDSHFPCATSTRLYPEWPLASLRHTPPALTRAVVIALLEMTREHDGLAWILPTDYQSVHDLFRTLETGPYAHLREPTLIALAERYWPWLLGLAGILALWTLYTVRVEHLVQSRTAELTAALANGELLEQQARANQEQAEHLSRLSILGELSSTIAHELNQPLAAILSYANSLLTRARRGNLPDQAVCEATQEIAGQAERASGILARIRAFGKKRTTVREIIAPREIIDEAITLFRSMFAHSPTITIHDGLPAHARIEADRLQIQQVLLNLLKNAWDAGRNLPPERQRIDLHLDSDATTVHIAVRDYGCGLDQGSREQLFQSFYTTKTDGLGLGLSICRSIAEAHHGRLIADTPVPLPEFGTHGALFILTLPLVIDPVQPPEGTPLA